MSLKKTKSGCIQQDLGSLWLIQFLVAQMSVLSTASRPAAYSQARDEVSCLRPG